MPTLVTVASSSPGKIDMDQIRPFLPMWGSTVTPHHMDSAPPAENRPLIGAHFSIAGGLDKALYAALEYGCGTCQVFTKNANSWREKDLDADQINPFKHGMEKTGIRKIASHGSYLINLASPETGKHARSCLALEKEVIRSDALGIVSVVLHPGFHMGSGEAAGIRKIAASINAIFEKTPETRTKLLLETTSGQGSGVGHCFEQLASILEKVTHRDRIGICLDTCHVFAAGYDIRSEAAYAETMAKLEKTIGIGNLSLIHLNDAKNPLGSKVDRHEHIGLGHIGIGAFECIMNDPRLEDIPKIIETPNPKGEDWDRVNLETLRGLVRD